MKLSLLFYGALLVGCSVATAVPPGPSQDTPPPAEDAGRAPVRPDAAPAEDATPAPDAEDAGDSGRPLPKLPLRTDGRWIVDASGKRFKLASVNWYGAEEKDHVVAGLDRARLTDIARTIASLGFNSVRLPWSNEMYESDPIVDAARVSANSELVGKHAMEILDRVIAALAHEGLVVILDNHASRADWCCSADDGNGLWYTDAYPESSWIADWKGIVKRYAGEPAVIGADLRNELRSANGKAAAWGGADPTVDWHAAAERGGNAVLAVNPKLLVFVEGLNYSTDFTGAYTLPVTLTVKDRLVYAPHDYAWFHTGAEDFASLHTTLGNKWGFLLAQGKAFTAPIWIGELGTCHTSASCIEATSGGGLWFQSFRKYLADADIDWAYWALNGTEATGTGRTLGAEETYGILAKSWAAPASAQLTTALAALIPATQGP